MERIGASFARNLARGNFRCGHFGGGRDDGRKPVVASSTGPLIHGVCIVLNMVLSTLFTIKFTDIRRVLTNPLLIKGIEYMALKLLNKFQGMANSVSQGASPKIMTLFITRSFTHNEKREQKCV
jgi:hypothetical protein